MSQNNTMASRLAVKTAEATFLHILETEFHLPPRTGRALLETAQDLLLGMGDGESVQPGQIRAVVTALAAPFGPELAASAKVAVVLTLDSGVEDIQVRASQGAEALRRGRILRLTDEALGQGGVLTQEDLARLLGVDRRTIERDVRALKAAGHSVATRGTVKNVGRGQTHKVKIIELWLNREGYDKISRWVHHSPQAIQRYVKTFLRLVALHREGKRVEEMAFLTQTTPRLVRDYLGLYERAMKQPPQREKIEEELERVGFGQAAEPQKGGPSR